MASTESMDLAQQLFVGYYGRPADPGGQEFWADQFDQSDDLTQALAAFGESQEFIDNFGSLTTEELVNNLYQQMFNRDVEPEGLAFYTARIDSGEATLSSIAKQIADGAAGDDLTTLNNKITVANTYTDTVEELGVEYTADDIPDAQALLADVDATDESVTAGNAAVEDLLMSSSIEIAYGETGDVAATGADDVFEFDAETALDDADNLVTQASITGFDTAADSLELDMTTAVGATTLDQLNGVDGVVVQVNPFAGDLVVNFGADANGGEPVVLTLGV